MRNLGLPRFSKLTRVFQMGAVKVTPETRQQQMKDFFSVKLDDVVTDQPKLKDDVLFCKSLCVYVCIFM